MLAARAVRARGLRLEYPFLKAEGSINEKEQALIMISSTPQILKFILHSSLLAFACLVSYLLMTNILYPIKLLLEDAKLLGGMWSVVATV